MSGRLVRSACTLALVGAAALALPAPQVLADPGGDTPPGSSSDGASSDGGTSGGSPDTGEGGLGRLTEGADSGGPGADGPVGTDSTDTASTSAGLGTSALLRKLRSLYRETEKAADAYRATQQDLRKARKKATVLNARLVKARTRLAGGRADTGRLARLQYQGSPETGLSSYLRILLSKDPEQAMERSHFLKEMAGGQAATIARLTAGEKKADALAAKARSALRKQQKLTARRLQQRAAFREKLTEVEEMLASLTEDQLTALSRLEDEDPGSTPNAPPADGKGGASDSPSPVGGPALRHGLERAVRTARARRAQQVRSRPDRRGRPPRRRSTPDSRRRTPDRSGGTGCRRCRWTGCAPGIWCCTPPTERGRPDTSATARSSNCPGLARTSGSPRSPPAHRWPPYGRSGTRHRRGRAHRGRPRPPRPRTVRCSSTWTRNRRSTRIRHRPTPPTPPTSGSRSSTRPAGGSPCRLRRPAAARWDVAQLVSDAR